MANRPKAGWKNRIVGGGEEPPDQLLANPRNWRVHPKGQQDALAGALDEVGWVTGVIVNRRSGCVVDGHLRVSLAISRGEVSVPVQYVDLDDREEAIVLASLDPIGALAGRDHGLLAKLVDGLEVGSDALGQLLAASAGLGGAVGEDHVDGPTFRYEEQYAVTVMCRDAAEQERVYEELTARGLECRVVVV